MFRLRILVTLHRYSSLTAGAELHTHWLMEELAQTNEVLIFARESDPSRTEYVEREYTAGHVNVRLINVTKRLPFWAYYRDSKVEECFEHLIKRFKPDVIFLAHTVGLSASLVEIAADSGIPTVVQLRDFFYMCHRLFLFKHDFSLCSGPNGGHKCSECMAPDLAALGSTLYRSPGAERTRYMRSILSKATLLFGHSDFLVEKYVEFGVPRNKIRVIEGGIDVASISSRRRKSTSRLRFGYFGILLPTKGVHTIVEAFVRKPSERAELHIYGGVAPESEAWVDQLKELSRGKRVYFHGEYSRAQLGNVLSRIDVFVHASIVHEHYPLTIREAFASKIPVIVSNLRAQCDAVRDGIDGLHFKARYADDLESKMELTLTKPRLLDDLRMNIPTVRTVQEEAEDVARELMNLVRK